VSGYQGSLDIAFQNMEKTVIWKKLGL
jgi:hypothetical protein